MGFQRLREKSQLPKTVVYGALNRDERNLLRRQLVRVDDHTKKSRLEIRRERRREQYRALSEDEREKSARGRAYNIGTEWR